MQCLTFVGWNRPAEDADEKDANTLKRRLKYYTHTIYTIYVYVHLTYISCFCCRSLLGMEIPMAAEGSQHLCGVCVGVENIEEKRVLCHLPGVCILIGRVKISPHSIEARAKTFRRSIFCPDLRTIAGRRCGINWIGKIVMDILAPRNGKAHSNHVRPPKWRFSNFQLNARHRYSAALT